jgi:hypothetical protein
MQFATPPMQLYSLAGQLHGKERREDRTTQPPPPFGCAGMGTHGWDGKSECGHSVWATAALQMKKTAPAQSVHARAPDREMLQPAPHHDAINALQSADVLNDNDLQDRLKKKEHILTIEYADMKSQLACCQQTLRDNAFAKRGAPQGKKDWSIAAIQAAKDIKFQQRVGDVENASREVSSIMTSFRVVHAVSRMRIGAASRHDAD